MNVRGRWLRGMSTWRKIALNTWSTPNNPTVYGVVEIDAAPLGDYLAQRSEQAGVKCTVTHAVTRAVGMTLRRHPECNVLVRGRRIWVRDGVDVFLQVAMPAEDRADKADLSGATIRDVDTKRVEQIARELKQQAKAVRERRDGEMAKTRSLLDRLPGLAVHLGMKALGFLQYDLNVALPGTPHDAFGGAMVTSVGMLGVTNAFVPIVTFSRCPILLLVGAVEDRAVVRDGRVVPRAMCTLTATFDHRIFDGVQAGRLAADLRRLLESPELLDRDPMEV